MKSTQKYHNTFSGILAFYYMNDVNQVPPVENKSIPGDSNPKTSCSADDIGEIDISEFMNPPNEHEIVNFIFHMIDVVMEQDNYF